MTTEPEVDFWLSGQLRIRLHGEVRTLRPTVRHQILALLLLRANSAVAVADIVRYIWPVPGQGGEDALWSHLSRIRMLLRDTECQLTTLRRRYSLQVDPMRVDVSRFGLLLERADRGDRDDQRRLVEAAMEVCPTDNLLSDFSRGWVRAARDEFRTTWRSALLRRNRYWLDDGEHERLVATLRREQVHMSADQRVAQDYLLALYRCGRVAEALAHYQHLVTRLEATGATVDRRLRALGERIAHQDPVLDLAGSPPASRAPDMLPPPTARLKGRRAEVLEIDNYAADRDAVGVVGIYGAPGIGKTALATDYAHRNKARYPGGVLYAQFAAAANTAGNEAIDAVLASFLRALGAGPDRLPADRSGRLARYHELVRRRATLVVLDDVGTSADAAMLLPTAPGSLAIVTSRLRLTKLTSHYGARAIVLGPIDQAASVALLSDLAGSRADWTPALVADVARACGGHPLALCLAGARLATRPEEPLRAVAEALSVPGRRIQTLDEHAESDAAVADVIGWSYHALDEPVARVFRLLGLSPCPTLNLPSLAHLVDRDPAQAQPLVDRLVALHLVTVTGGSAAGTDRYGMLDLVAEYAATMAARVDGADARARALDRLYDHYRAAARAAAHTMWPTEVPSGPDGYSFDDPVAARAWLDDHRDDLVAAAGHAHATNRPAHVVDLANSLFRYLDHGGYLDQAVALHEMAVAAAVRLGDERTRLRSLSRLGAVLVRRGPADRAESVLTQARELSAQVGDAHVQGVVLGNLGRLTQRRGAYAEAVTHHQAALTFFRRCGDPLGQARTLTNLGIVLNASGQFAQALRHLEEASRITEQIEAADAAARVTGTMAASLRGQGRLDEADECYRKAIEAFRALGDRVGEATCVSRLGLVRSDQGRHQQAIDLHRSALKIFTEVGDEDGMVDTLLNLGAALRAAGQHIPAVRSHWEALDRAGAIGSEGHVAQAHASLAEDYVAHAERVGTDAASAPALARQHAEEAVGRYRALGVEPPGAVVALARRLRRAEAGVGGAWSDA